MKRSILSIALISLTFNAFASGCELPIQNSNKIAYNYEANVVKVIDGDTFKAQVSLGISGISVYKSVRVRGIDTAETYNPKSPEEKKHGEQASILAKKILNFKRVILINAKDAIYNRVEADVMIPSSDCKMLSDILREAGMEKRDKY